MLVYAGQRDANSDKMANLDIRRLTDTPTVKSPLYARYIRRIFTWNDVQSTAYLNNKIELNNAFIEFDKRINTLIRDLTAKHTCICNSHICCIPRNYIQRPKATDQQKHNIATTLNKIQPYKGHI